MNAPLNYFLHSHGPASHDTMVLGWVFTAISLLVCLIITVLLAAAIWRRRPEENTELIGHGGHGLRWVGIGTGVSTAVLFALAIYSLIVLNRAATPPHQPAITISVTGYDWWWKVVYANNDPALQIITANEIHIPTGQPVRVKLASADVIHAFWVPQLAGKTQMIPGLTNEQWLQADTPGIYRGQCTQFCGLQHAHMALEVVAESPEDFARWQTAQRQPASNAPPPVFISQCAACHTVQGTQSNGGHAPDLTHLASRRLIAAGLMTNTQEHRMDWIQHAQSLKPGSRMPDITLSPDEATQLSTYLKGLK